MIGISKAQSPDWINTCWSSCQSPRYPHFIQWVINCKDVSRKLYITRTTRTPAFWGYSPQPHDYPFYWVILDPKSEEDKVKVTNLKNSPKFWNKHYTRHTFWSCLIRCANMKWIRWVLLKIQSGHDSVHRRTDGQGETSIPPHSTSLKWGE